MPEHPKTRTHGPAILGALLIALLGLAAPASGQHGPNADLPLGIPESEAAASDQREQDVRSLGPGAVQTIGSLAAVIGVILVAAAGMRTVARKRGGMLMALGPGGRAPSGLVDVLARYPLGGGQLLILFRVGPRVVAACQTQGRRGSVRTLCEFNDPEEVAGLLAKAHEADGDSFMDRFRKASADSEWDATEADRTGHPAESVYAAAREITESEDGDRVELLSTAAVGSLPEPGPEPGPTAEDDDDPISALRDRLARLRGEGVHA